MKWIIYWMPLGQKKIAGKYVGTKDKTDHMRTMKGLDTVESLSAGAMGSIFFITLGLTKIKAFL